MGHQHKSNEQCPSKLLKACYAALALTLFTWLVTQQFMIGHIPPNNYCFSIGGGYIEYGYGWDWIRQKMIGHSGMPPQRLVCWPSSRFPGQDLCHGVHTIPNYLLYPRYSTLFQNLASVVVAQARKRCRLHRHCMGAPRLCHGMHYYQFVRAGYVPNYTDRSGILRIDRHRVRHLAKWQASRVVQSRSRIPGMSEMQIRNEGPPLRTLPRVRHTIHT